MTDLSDLSQISAPLPWQLKEWAHLQEQLAGGQLPHALLLVGGQYTGKSQLALALSRLLLCIQTEGLLNCGRCHACELSRSGNHGDFRWVEPLEKSRVIKIEQIRDVVRFTNKTAGFGLRKVIVLAPADSMNVNAFNALLKLLEEPPKDTYLILVCHRMYCIPPTIRSRCQILRLQAPHTEACLEWLDATTGKRDQSQQLLSSANGMPLLAQQLYSSGRADEFSEKCNGIHALLAGEISALQAGALWSEGDVSAFLEQLAINLQRVLSSLSLECLRSSGGRALFRLLDEVFRLQRTVSAGANPSKQLLMDALLSKCRRELGTDLLGGIIQSQIGAARV